MKFPGMNRIQELTQQWEQNLSWEQILELEAQGTDVSEIKQRFLAKQQQLEELEKNANILRYTNAELDPKFIPNPTKIAKLKPWFEQCKNPDSPIIRDTVGKAPLLFGKSKWAENIRSSEILLTAVVQCDPQLWKSITDEITPASYLLVYSLNPKYARNIEVMKKVAKLLNDYREQTIHDPSKYSKTMLQLHKDLDQPQSTPHLTIDSTLLKEIGIEEADADIRVASNYIYSYTPLPNNMLPSDGILPFIRFREKNLRTKDSFAYATRLIPAKYYQ
ncbi:MAG: hypothetical protein N4A35_11795 [Flavobacteriales bacterium]|jgi:hypothetical protein|nr:hypothetical protein [Flavobacteriales bacterium]